MHKLLALLVLSLVFLAYQPPAWAETQVHLWLPPEWKNKVVESQQMSDELSRKSGVKVVCRVATSYPEILRALAEQSPELALVGSMVQAVAFSRRLAMPIFQAVNGRHFYGGVMLFAKGGAPLEILHTHPTEVAYTVGATSGETCAKAATNGKAAMGVSDHKAAAEAVKAGKAKAAFVKDTWWADNQKCYPGLDSFAVPEISNAKNADNVMLASRHVAPELRSMIMGAAIYNPHIFKANVIVPFDSSTLDFTLELMKKAGIDPLTYAFPE